MSSITLRKNNISINIDEISGNLQSIKYKDNNMYFNKSIWKIELIKDNINTNCFINDINEFRYTLKDDCINMIWENDVLIVRVNIVFENNKFKWGIDVETKSNLTYINKVVFPIIGCVKPIAYDGKNDFLLLPWQNGWLIKDPIHTLLNNKEEIPFWVGRGNYKYENEYPAQYSYQFASYYSSKNYGYYFSTEDSDAHIKTMGFYYDEKNNGFDFAITNYPENMGKTQLYNMPYFFVLDFFEGDWQQATNLYRDWAINQKWCQKKLCNKDISEKIRNIDLWRINHMNYALGKRTQEYFETSVMLKQKLDCNLALHWYGWNMGEHDVNYPEYISTEYIKDGWSQELKKWNKKFTQRNIIKIPYINARMWDVNTKSWINENAQEAALKNENMQMYEEPWKLNNLKPMCPATSKWKDKIVSLCNSYIKDNAFDGIYMDQIGSFNAALCFDEKHVHPIGGGSWWNDSYHKIVDLVKSSVDKQIIVTTESCCETYIDVFDLFLILDTNLQEAGFPEIAGGNNCEQLPLFSMIYGDYALSYGSICRMTDTLEVFEFNFVRNLLWGILPTIEGFELEEINGVNANKYLDIVKRGIDFYKENKQLILYGKLKNIPLYECDKMQISWSVNGDTYTKEYPQVMVAIWQDNDGNDVLILYNFGDKPQKIYIGGEEINVDAVGFKITLVK